MHQGTDSELKSALEYEAGKSHPSDSVLCASNFMKVFESTEKNQNDSNRRCLSNNNLKCDNERSLNALFEFESFTSLLGEIMMLRWRSFTWMGAVIIASPRTPPYRHIHPACLFVFMF